MKRSIGLAALLAAVAWGPALSRDSAALLKDCERGDSEACTFLGSHHQWGTGGVQQDADLALKYYTKACDGGHGQGCFGIGLIHDDPSNPRKDPAKALEAYRKACERRNEYGCGAYEAKKNKGK